MTNDLNADSSLVEPTQRLRPNQPILPLLIVLFGLTVSAQLVSLAFGRVDESQAFSSIVLPSVLFISVITLPSILLGLSLGRHIGLGAPLLAELLFEGRSRIAKARRDIGLACVIGIVLGGLLLLIRQISEPYLPPEIPAYGHRGALGGLAVSVGAAVAEEVWFRLGLMTLMIWGWMRLWGQKTIKPMVAWTIIVCTSVAFGMAHLPQLMSYGAGSPFAIVGTIMGNTAVGILYGWCYWKKGLIAAMVAHFSVDIVIHVLPAFAQ